MENATDVHVELVKLMDGLSRADVPHDAIVQDKVIRGVKRGTVALVVVGQVRVIEGQDFLSCLNVIYLQKYKDNLIIYYVQLWSYVFIDRAEPACKRDVSLKSHECKKQQKLNTE